MKITVVSQYFPPESNAPAVRTFEHAREWVRQGHDVTVVCALPHHPAGVIPPEYQGRLLVREEVEGIRVLRTWILAFPNRGVFRRGLTYLSFGLSAAVQGRRYSRRPDVLVATSPQLLGAVGGWLLSLFFRVPFVLELRDIWPESAEEMGVVRSSLLLWPFRLLQRLLYRSAERVVTVSRGFLPHLRGAGVAEERIEYVPNGVRLELLEQSEGREAAEVAEQELELGDRFVVGYLGTLGLAHGLDAVLDTAARLRDESDVHFLFVGDGARREALEARARSQRLGNVTFLGQQPRSRVLGLYSLCDVCLVPLRDLPMFRKVLPSKLFEIMGLGVPVICSVEGVAGELVERSGGGIVIAPEDPAALTKAVLDLRNDPDRRARMGRAGRDFVRREHDRRDLATRLLAVLDEVIAS